ncbi:unnamed protein product [Caenorhabditis bovis]|uniref:Uncharacterized protein n=1 Tax=Caenorhabditis bovis TaxID=2654633 RepID=A0A8S1F8Q2_9PELO|nr:unnamed protein product [Caenorhabditis bovis]
MFFLPYLVATSVKKTPTTSAAAKDSESRSPARSLRAQKPKKSPTKAAAKKSSGGSRSRSRSRGRQTAVKTPPARAASKSRSTSRSRAAAVPKSESKAAIKTTPKTTVRKLETAKESATGERTSRTFERADDESRSLRHLTQSRERPAINLQSSPHRPLPAGAPQCCAIFGGIKQGICNRVKSATNRVKTSHRNLKRRMGFWYLEAIVFLILAVVVTFVFVQIQKNDPAKLRLLVTSNVNKGIKYVTESAFKLKDKLSKKL